MQSFRQVLALSLLSLAAAAGYNSVQGSSLRAPAGHDSEAAAEVEEPRVVDEEGKVIPAPNVLTAADAAKEAYFIAAIKNYMKFILKMDKYDYTEFAHAAFDRFDADKDGYLDSQEVTAFIKQLNEKWKEEPKGDFSTGGVDMGWTGAPTLVAKKLLGRIDADKDGKISKGELIAYINQVIK